MNEWETNIEKLAQEKERLKQENERLRQEIQTYRNLYAEERDKSQKPDPRVEAAKDLAAKGITTTQEALQITKNVFSVAREAFKDEWQKKRRESTEPQSDTSKLKTTEAGPVADEPEKLS